MDITKILEILPFVFQYFLPGFIFMQILGSQNRNHDELKESAYLYLVFIISFILIAFTKFIFPCIENLYYITLIATLLSFIISFVLIVLINKNVKFDRYVSKYLGYSDKNAIESIVDANIGAFARVTFKEFVDGENLSVIGELHSYDSSSQIKTITLCTYRPVIKKHSKKIIKPFLYQRFDYLKDKNYFYLVIPIESILFFELVEK